MTATMKNNENKSSEIMKSNSAHGKAVHSFSSKRKSKETRDFDLNEPFIHTTPESSPSRIRIDILPNIQVPVQTPLDFPSPAEEHATKDSERVHSSNDAKKMKLTIDLNAEIGDETPISCSEVAREIRSLRSIDLEAIPEDFPPSASSNKIDNADETTEGPQENADTAEDDRVGSEARKRKNCEEDNKIKILSRSIRELRPRVAVQIESEVMILDDGYRWRKYGQKVIKGNLNHRSYYKCTSAGCPVRKHVERDSRNLKYVITTYEGKHNHEAPPTGSRNKSQMHPDGGNPAALPSAQPPTLAPHYHTNPVFNNELLRHGFGSFNSYMNFGSSSSPQMLYSFLNNNNNPIPYSSSGLNLDRYATPQMFLESFNAPSSGHNSNSGSSSALSFRITGERYWVPPRP